MRAGARVLVIEDHAGIRESLRYHLDAVGYKVLEAADGTTGLRAARTGRPDLLILDLMLPGLSGLEVCRLVRETSRVPILILSARGEEIDKVLGLEVGADDYVTKPFSIAELMARVHALLRRTRYEPIAHHLPDCEETGGLIIDRAARRATLDGRELRMTAREFELLSFLVGHRGRVHSRERLLHEVWGAGFSGDSKTVDVHIRGLRMKLGGGPVEIVTVRGSGYRLDAPIPLTRP